MEYAELDIYVGRKNGCDHCERAFQPGEVFTLSDQGRLAFCYSDGDGGCMQEYMFFKMEPKRMLIGRPVVFLKASPAMPVARPERLSLAERIRRMFRRGR